MTTAPSTSTAPTRRRIRAATAMVILAILGGISFAAVQLALRQPRLHRGEGRVTLDTGERPWGRVLGGPGHHAHLAGARAVACADCHDVKAASFQAPDASRCNRCHADVEVTIHPAASAPAETRECTTCHAFLADSPATDAWGCVRCHDKAQGKFGAVVVHAKEACGGCHRPHATPSLQPLPCTDCHRDERPHHGDRGIATTECRDCHQPHDRAGVAAASCARCHQDPATRAVGAPRIPVTATAPGKHETCVGCHTPHEFTRRGVARCQTCHASQVTLGQFTARPHSECTSCHAPHDPLASPASRCKTCHAAVHLDHPDPARKGDCTGCHPIHARTRQASIAVACSSCHTQAATDTAFHGGKAPCTGCHVPHGFAKPSPTACATCHQRETSLAQGNGHRACTGCHQPHAPKNPPKACTSCHAAQTKLVATNTGHQACTGCHTQPHNPRTELTPCRTCHTAEAGAMPSGHAGLPKTCASCHEPHAGAPTVARCASCHADRATGPHLRVNGGCTTCHRAHGPKGPAQPPACKTCHDKPLPALHAKPAHADCAGCHTSHGGPRGDRATCMTCHTDRANHEPGARSCIGCHVFGARP